MNYALLLSFLVLPYFFMFTYFEQARLTHRQHKNVFKVEVTEVPTEMLGLQGHMSDL